jgi:HD-like signal output (HDOD) protein
MDNAKEIAFTMAELSYHVHGVEPDEAFLAGIFHNSGSLLLASKDSEYNKIFDQAKSLPYKSLEYEREAFGCLHTAAGVILAKKWQLPVFVIQVIYDHHIHDFAEINDEKTKLLAALVGLATYIVAETSLGAYIGSEMSQYADNAKDTLMIDDNVIKSARMALQTYSS